LALPRHAGVDEGARLDLGGGGVVYQVEQDGGPDAALVALEGGDGAEQRQEPLADPPRPLEEGVLGALGGEVDRSDAGGLDKLPGGVGGDLDGLLGVLHAGVLVDPGAAADDRPGGVVEERDGDRAAAGNDAAAGAGQYPGVEEVVGEAERAVHEERPALQ